MTNSLSPRIRAAIINYDPTQPNALTITEFCRSVKISRGVFYKIRPRAAQESTAALHPRSRAPKTPARRYGPEVTNELVRIRKHLKTEGWDYGPKSIWYEASIQESFPGGDVPSVAHDRALAGQRGAGRGFSEEAPEILLHPFRQVHGDVVMAAGCLRVSAC